MLEMQSARRRGCSQEHLQTTKIWMLKVSWIYWMLD